MSDTPTASAEFNRAVREAKKRPVRYRMPPKTSMAKPSISHRRAEAPMCG